MTSPDPTDRERFNYEILKYELETFQSLYKNFEKTYLLIIGISIFYYLFFIKFLYCKCSIRWSCHGFCFNIKKSNKSKGIGQKNSNRNEIIIK